MTFPYHYWNIGLGLFGLFLMIWGFETNGTKKRTIEAIGVVSFGTAILAAFITAGIKNGIIFVIAAIPIDWIIRDGIRALVKKF